MITDTYKASAQRRLFFVVYRKPRDSHVVRKRLTDEEKNNINLSEASCIVQMRNLEKCFNEKASLV